MPRQAWIYLAFTFGSSWLIWTCALRLGAGPGTGEQFLAFGVAAPAIVAVFLSRSRRVIEGNVRGHFLARLGLLWLLCWAVYEAREGLRGADPTISSRLVVAILAFLPAWILAGALPTDAGVRDFLRTLVRWQNWRWLAAAFLFFPVILLVPAAIARLFGATVVAPDTHGAPWRFVASAAVTFLYQFFFEGVFEEPGWRGFLLPRLQLRSSPLLASLLVWLFWALWHAPLDFSGGVASTWLHYLQIRVAFFIPITIILTWLFNRSGGNILSAALFHAGLNTFPFVLPFAPTMLPLIFVWAAYVVVRDRMWRRLGEETR